MQNRKFRCHIFGKLHCHCKAPNKLEIFPEHCELLTQPDIIQKSDHKVDHKVTLYIFCKILFGHVWCNQNCLEIHTDWLPWLTTSSGQTFFLSSGSFQKILSLLKMSEKSLGLTKDKVMVQINKHHLFEQNEPISTRTVGRNLCSGPCKDLLIKILSYHINQCIHAAGTVQSDTHNWFTLILSYNQFFFTFQVHILFIDVYNLVISCYIIYRDVVLRDIVRGTLEPELRVNCIM